MRVDHLAYRTKDRHKTAAFFVDVFGYKIQEEFEVAFEDGKMVKCLVLTPPEKKLKNLPWQTSEIKFSKDKIEGGLSSIANEFFLGTFIGFIISTMIYLENIKLYFLPWLAVPFIFGLIYTTISFFDKKFFKVQYHMAPEIFISDGQEGSIVKEWVEQRGGVGGIHHIAYQVDSVELKMKEMKELGYFEFTTDKPLTCDGLKQVFTKPSELTGIIYEFIERDKQGFCKDNVKDLMNSTKNIK